VDMRVIASAQHSLHEMVEQATFRRDLYFRLNVVNIQLPTLRDRRDCIVSLFLEMIQKEAEYFKLPAPPPPESLLQQLFAHSWPGNVRELRSTAKRFVLGLPVLSNSPTPHQDKKTSLKSSLQQIEKMLIEASLRRHGYCVNTVATELSVSKRTLYHRIKHLEISLA